MESKEIFAQRLIELREKRDITQQTLADDLNITRQSLSLYEKAERTINIDLLVKIAKYFDVSTDYLLGLNDNTTTDTDMQAVCNYTGLTETAIAFVQDIKNRGYIDILNTFLANWSIILILENINKTLDETEKFNNDNNITDVFNEFIDMTSTNPYMKMTLYDDREVKNRIRSLCNFKFEDTIEFYYYKCEKALKTRLENMVLDPAQNCIDDMTDKIYSMYVKQCEEASENGKHNPKKE